MIATTGLKGLRIDCVVGVYTFEREQLQPIIIDIELDYDVSVAASSDEVGDAVDYDRVVEGVVELVGRREFCLIETMAEETADMLLVQHASVQRVRLEIRKPNAVAVADCSFVRLERVRR
jgi:dihydroneopterin aldolase